MGDRLLSGIIYKQMANIIESHRLAAKVDRLYSNIWQLSTRLRHFRAIARS
ncbi:hypothetical protein QUB08_16990 [Microcoleus sp. BR0-C5]|uniref:hypothetical protein n=1 Tax=Microcoleus sp. BR0-C5 TaxID=2818713 RepID=UPI002FD6F685